VRVAVVTEIIAPYRIPVFNELSRLLAGGLQVYFIAASERRRDWTVPLEEIEFSYHVLGGLQTSIPLRGDRLPIYLSRPLLPHLARGGYDAVVVGGWNHLECYQALAYAKARRRSFTLWSETPQLGAFPRRPLRNSVKRAVVRASSSFAVPGRSAARYLESLGASPGRISIAPNAVDNAYWSARPPDTPPRAGDTLLYVGRLERGKGADIAIAAFGRSRLAASHRLLVVGDGPERPRLEAVAGPRVEFRGTTRRDALRRIYHCADVLVVPSRFDSWGLVLNEAACAGLPAVATTHVGAAVDLIDDGHNGLLVEAENVEAMRRAFDRLGDDPGLASSLGANVHEIAEACSPERCAAGLLAAVELA
jgi:glycosyltransferase involved in cell wall biosynthesis